MASLPEWWSNNDWFTRGDYNIKWDSMLDYEVQKEDIMAKSKWFRKWYVPRSKGGFYTVSISRDGKEWGCSCPNWKFRREQCKHIKEIQSGGGLSYQKPSYILTKNVLRPEYDEDSNTLNIPLENGKEFPTEMNVCICYYMLMYGYTIGEIRSIRNLPTTWTINFIQEEYAFHGDQKLPKKWFGAAPVKNRKVRKLAI